MDSDSDATKRRIRALLALLLALAAVRLALLPAYPLIDSTEGRYAEIAREMETSGDWVNPRLEPDVPFWGKPPLSFWATAFSLRALGHHALAARLPSLLLAMLTVALVVHVGTRMGDRSLGLAAGAVLATMALFHALAGVVITDVALAACTTLALAAIPLAAHAEGPRRRTLWGYVFFAGVGLGVLAKGPVAAVLVGLVVAPAALLGRAPREALRALPWRRGVLLTALLVVPWHLAAEIRTPGFLHYYLVGEHLKRFLVRDWEGDLYGSPHEEPLGTIVWFAVQAALPWWPLGLAAVVWLRRRSLPAHGATPRPWVPYLGLWAAAPLLLFAPSQNVMLTYVLPGLPGLAILVSGALSTAAHHGGQGAPAPLFARPRVLLGTALFVPFVTVLASLLVFPFTAEERSQKELVALFEELDRDGDASLVYVDDFDDVPHSGDFYADGRARVLPREDAGPVLAELDDGDRDYFAIEADEVKHLPERVRDRTREVARVGDYTLRREPHVGDRPPVATRPRKERNESASRRAPTLHPLPRPLPGRGAAQGLVLP